MIAAGDVRKGITVEYNGSVYVVTDFQHVKPGKGAAFVRTRLKNVITGAILEHTFNPSEKLARAHIETKKMSYSYNDGELYYFMDDEFNLTPLNYSQVEDSLMYIKENDTVTIRFHKGSAFSVECENFVELKVIEAEPGVRGDTATNVTKQVTVETGAKFNVPMFVNEGETIRIDTRTGEYMERVK